MSSGAFRCAHALVNEPFATLGEEEEVRAEILARELEPQVLSIALVLLDQREG